VSEHELKTWPEYFAEVRAGRKAFEIRQNDRGFAVGDTLILREWDPENGGYTGNVEVRRVTYMVQGRWEIPPGVCVMSLAPLRAPAPPPSTGDDLLSFIRREREKWRSGPKAAFGLLSAPEMVELFDHLEHLASAPPSTGDEARGEIERLVDKLIGVVAARKAVGRVTPFDKRTKEHSARAALLAAVSRALAATNPEPETKEIDR
jgi:hypothetical protein